jgi:ribosomal protein L24
MKSVTLIFIFLVFSIGVGAQQDTIVSTKGLIIPAYIIASDSLFTSYRVADTLNKEINLILNSNLLLVKHKDGKVEKIYKNDTLITMEGQTVLTKIIEIDNDLLTCFYFDGVIHELTIVPSSSIFMYKLQDGTRQLIDHKKKENTENNELTKDDAVKYYIMGTKDAAKYFRTDKGAIVGEVLFGITAILIYPIIGAIIIGCIKPSKLHNSQNPNDILLSSNPNYKEGYLEIAKIKKRKSCFAAFGSGVAGLVGGIILAFTFW